MQGTSLTDREADGNFRAPRANLQISDFEIIGRIGDGSFSTVILARLKGATELVAIKIVNKHLVLRNKMADYIRNERNILDKLNNECIVKLLFTFQDSDSLYFGCEYCPGGDLYEQINKKGKLAMDAARFYTAEIVQMLEYLRSKQVVHRDLKPENLLLTSTGHLKLTDFGSARAFFLPPTGGTGKQARATSFVGTAEYVSPEVLNNTPLSYPADLWALGSLVYQMIAGTPPFKAASEYLTFQKVAEREFEFPEEFPEVARDLVDKLLQLEPEDRIGASDIGELKSHPFFDGIDWQRLREQEAPDIIPPPGPTPELEGLDWEITSLTRTTIDELRVDDSQAALNAAPGTVLEASTATGPGLPPLPEMQDSPMHRPPALPPLPPQARQAAADLPAYGGFDRRRASEGGDRRDSWDNNSDRVVYVRNGLAGDSDSEIDSRQSIDSNDPRLRFR